MEFTSKKGEITREEFITILQESFTTRQIMMINPQIYLNGDHLEYYELYHMGKYNDCLDYLDKHIHLLDSKSITNKIYSRQQRKEMLKRFNEMLKNKK